MKEGLELNGKMSATLQSANQVEVMGIQLTSPNEPKVRRISGVGRKSPPSDLFPRFRLRGVNCDPVSCEPFIFCNSSMSFRFQELAG